MDVDYESGNVTPFLSDAELFRARERLRKREWEDAALLVGERTARVGERHERMPEFDHSWYDENPNRDYGETYVPFHDYARPASRLAADARQALLGGLLLQRAELIDKSVEWALHLAHRFKFSVSHHDSGLVYSHIGEAMAEVYTGAGDAMDGKQRDILEDGLTRCGEAIRLCTRHWLTNLSRMPYNNHFAAHRRAMLCLALALQREDWAHEALCGERAFGEFLVGATMDDGLCYESSTLYHFATLSSLIQTAELTRHAPALGRDLYEETFANGRRLKDMLDSVLGLLLPTGELPAFGDCYANRQPIWQRSAALYEKAYAVYGDPRYAWLLMKSGPRRSSAALLFGVDRLGKSEAPCIQSRTWVEHGYGFAVAGNPDDYWRGEGFCAAMTGDRSGVHFHRDSLSLLVAGGGRLWTEDAESRAVEHHGFSAPIQQAFNRTILAHNLVVVDEADQATLSKPLRVDEFTSTPTLGRLGMADPAGRLVAGVAMARTVCVTPGYCLDVFQLASDGDHVYDWLVHPRADGPVECGYTFSTCSLPDRGPYGVLHEIGSAGLRDDGVRLSWRQEHEAILLAVTAVGGAEHEAPLQTIRALWPIAGDWSEGGREMFMLRCRGSRVAFIALYQLEGPGDERRISGSRRVWNGEYEEIRLSVQGGGHRDDYVLRAVETPPQREPAAI